MFAVRQKSTGFFVSAIPNSQRGGGTLCEPDKYCCPRLFRRRQDASCFLAWWKQGHATVSNHVDIYGRKREDWDVIPRPDRDINDMEIVEVELRVK